MLVIMPETKSTVALILYAILGAFGFALSKEAKLQRRELVKVSEALIVKRISKSDIVTDTTKERYIKSIKAQPALSMNHFIRFLEEENRIMDDE